MVERQRAKGLLTPPPGQVFEVEIVMPGGQAYPEKGRVSFADPSFSQQTGSFLVSAVLPNPKKQLMPGMFVTANVRGGTRDNAVFLPQLSVQQGPNGHVVYVVNVDGRAELRPVR